MKALVVALSEVLRLYKNPQEPIRLVDWGEKLNVVQDEAEKCCEAAAAVGSVADRLKVSRTLCRLQTETEKWAEWMLAARKLNVADSAAVQRWHAEAMLPIDRLRLAIGKHDISIEMHEAVSLVEKPPEPTLPPLGKVQRKIMDALNGQAMTGEELEMATECSARSIARHIKGLVDDFNLVKNDIKIGGYYRPDAPPT